MGKKFGEFLRHLREQRELTLRDVEKSAKISNAYLSQIERGERGIPNFKILNRLADAYGISVTVLIEAAESEVLGEEIETNTTPDVKFVSRGYEKLSDDSKQMLTEFLQHLINKEKHKQKEK